VIVQGRYDHRVFFVTKKNGGGDFALLRRSGRPDLI
jgi:hypothetical protein